ncbi:hypothetical protein SLS58_008676 [Diplodia intermedia]|uniref:DUF6590 domain-containing protein n=1 Tax=Diplodia intermedia TaxID=856260 RepID=A0ABR3TH25_9PEZI
MNQNTEWVWHAEAKNYYRHHYDGGTVDIQGAAAGGLGETIRGNEEGIDSESLDPGYMIQHRRFFTQGRMFSILFTEPCGENATAGPTTRRVDNISTVMFNQRVFSNIRRFIVVKEGRGFAYACPVSTYGGRATTKPGLEPQQHAIVYITGSQPQYVPNEQRLQKAPIPIIPAEGSMTLSGASRVNFAIHHPIQHNVKVKDLGTVHHDYIPTLISYAKMESGW